MSASIQAFHSLQDSLAKALVRGELLLQYQPIVDLSEKIVGMEALMRWNSPEFGEIPPSLFVPLAERSGAIGSMGAWVLEEGCRQLERWSHNPTASEWTLSINISAHQFNNSNFVDDILDLLKRYRIEPGKLILELTESAFLNAKGSKLQNEFQRIRDAGVGIAVDDFGTGFSSMCYLRYLPISHIKIDKTFIDEVAVSKKDQGIVEATVMLAKALEVEVVAEGVETAAQLTYLKNAGCSTFQGFLFGKPGDISKYFP